MASKRALLIGINYIGTPNELHGCIYDIIQIKSMLIDVYGFDPKQIICLRDDDPSNKPTAAKIREELTKIVASGATFNVLHYSGHGTNIADSSKDESDGMDECIVPCDFATSGIIRDDELNSIIKPIKGAGFAIFDCCRSGTILDLPYTNVNMKSNAIQNGGFFCFSGCQDSDVSAETVSELTGLPQGAMTTSLIQVLRNEKYYPTLHTLLRKMSDDLKSRGFTQIPQISSTNEVTLLTPFPLPKDMTLTAILNENTSLKNQVVDLSKKFADASRQVTTMTRQVADLSKEVTLLRTENTKLKASRIVQINK